MSSSSRKSLQGGYCGYPEGSCAFELTDCNDGTVFKSSRMMQGSPERAHGGVCLLKETALSKEVGSCVSRTSMACSPNEESCVGYGNYVGEETGCTVAETKFGRCGNRCSWSPSDCEVGEDWTFPVEDCTCDRVRVGACLRDGFPYCAVSKDSCDSLTSWHSPLNVTETANVRCYLCQEKKTTNSYSSSTIVVVGVNTVAGDGGATLPSIATYSGASKNKSILFYGILGGLLGILLLLSIFALLRTRAVVNEMKRHKPEEKPQKKKKIDNTSLSQPPKSVLMGDFSSEQDDISVLSKEDGKDGSV